MVLLVEDAVDLASEIRRHMQLTVDNKISLTQFRHWLEDNDSAIDDEGDVAVDLSSDLWLALSEYDRGHWDTPRIHAEIARLLNPYELPTKTESKSVWVRLSQQVVIFGEIHERVAAAGRLSFLNVHGAPTLSRS
jgi:hypothetical protein